MAPPFRLSEEERAQLAKEYFAGETQQKLSAKWGISMKTCYEYIRRAREELAGAEKEHANV